MRKYFLLCAVTFAYMFAGATAFAEQSTNRQQVRTVQPGSTEEKILKQRKQQKLQSGPHNARVTEPVNRTTNNPKKQKSKDDDSDADALITNAKMRAEAGSKSKFSVATAFQYMGGTVEKPFDAKRPNIKGAAATTSFTTLTGQISGKWNMTKVDSLFLGLGVKMLTPFAGEPPKEAGQRYDASDPTLIYQRLMKLGGVQTVAQLGGIAYTAKDVRDVGYLGETNVQLTFAYDFGGSPFTLGFSFAGVYRFFDKDTSEAISVVDDEKNNVTITTLAGAVQDDYSLGYYPFVEYQINDTFNLRTLIGFQYDHARVEDNTFAYKKNKVYQSVGLGISVTRDIFLYPNIQFLPDDMRSDKTNVALSTNINLF